MPKHGCRPAIRLCFIAMLGFVLTVMTVFVAVSQPELRAARPEEPTSFDIPAQPLEDALLAYAQATGGEVFVDHALTAGQQSAPVRGAYGFEAGLRQLLVGTGLEFRRAAHHSYTLVAVPAPEPPLDRTPAWSAEGGQSRFFAALQAAIKQTLCARPETMPGQYRAALAIWIGPSGNVVGVRMLGANGKAQTAHRLLDGIKGISVGLPPPAGLQQPVTFVVLPRPPDRTGDCGSTKTDRG